MHLYVNNVSRTHVRNNMWVQIEQAVLILALQMLWCPNLGHTLQVQERASLKFLHQVLPQSVFIICHLTSQRTLPYLLGLPSILRMEAEKAWNKAWSYNSTFVWNVRKKKKTCLENIFSFGLVSSLMPRLPCPCGEHLVVWFKFLNCHIAMSGKCIIIVPRMQFPLLAAWLLCNPAFKQSATFPNHQHISRLWKNWQTFSFQSPTLR